MSEQGYIDTGDRVRFTEALRAAPALVGALGTVISNDGWGLCCVALDDGGYAQAWNGCDLERADTAEPLTPQAGIVGAEPDRDDGHTVAHG